MDTNEINVALFITEVRKRPELWDLNCQDYRYIKKKKRAWLDIASVCIPEFDASKHSEKLMYRNLKEKWRNIRDSFVRAKRLKNSKYVYTKHLSFLNVIYGGTSCSDNEETRPTTQTSFEDSPETEDSNEFRIIKIDPDYNSDHSNPELEATSLDESTKQNNKSSYPVMLRGGKSALEDDDGSFFDAILPAVRCFNIDQKLRFMSGVLELVKKIRSES